MCVNRFKKWGPRTIDAAIKLQAFLRGFLQRKRFAKILASRREEAEAKKRALREKKRMAGLLAHQQREGRVLK